MLFSSIVFLFTFLPAVMILYYLLPVRFRNVILLLASLVFYAWGEPVYLFLMLLSILFNYFSGLDIARNLFLIMHCRFRLEYPFIHSRYYPISLIYIGEM